MWPVLKRWMPSGPTQWCQRSLQDTERLPEEVSLLYDHAGLWPGGPLTIASRGMYTKKITRNKNWGRLTAVGYICNTSHCIWSTWSREMISGKQRTGKRFLTIAENLLKWDLPGEKKESRMLGKLQVVPAEGSMVCHMLVRGSMVHHTLVVKTEQWWSKDSHIHLWNNLEVRRIHSEESLVVRGTMVPKVSGRAFDTRVSQVEGGGEETPSYSWGQQCTQEEGEEGCENHFTERACTEKDGQFNHQ